MKIRGQVVYTPKERLMRLTVIGDGGCWNWLGPLRNGYGRLCVGSRKDKRRTVAAHRYSWQVFRGDIPDGLNVLHHCDNRKCINPDHLFIGTQQDNIDDRESKGRNRPPKGSRNGRAKLTELEVAEMRKLRPGMRYVDIAARFGVSKKTAWKAIKGTAWTHVPEPPPPAKEKA